MGWSCDPVGWSCDVSGDPEGSCTSVSVSGTEATPTEGCGLEILARRGRGVDMVPFCESSSGDGGEVGW